MAVTTLQQSANATLTADVDVKPKLEDAPPAQKRKEPTQSGSGSGAGEDDNEARVAGGCGDGRPTSSRVRRGRSSTQPEEGEDATERRAAPSPSLGPKLKRERSLSAEARNVAPRVEEEEGDDEEDEGKPDIPPARPAGATIRDIHDLSSWGFPDAVYPTGAGVPARTELERGFKRQGDQRALAPCPIIQWCSLVNNPLSGGISGFLCLREGENLPHNGPGKPWFFWDDLASNVAVLDAIKAAGPINFLYRNGSNNWEYRGTFVAGYSGTTEPDEVAGFLSEDQDRREEWRRVLKYRYLHPKKKYLLGFRECGLTDFSDAVEGKSLADQLDRRGSGVSLHFTIMKPVGFDVGLMQSWVKRRNGVYT